MGRQFHRIMWSQMYTADRSDRNGYQWWAKVALLSVEYVISWKSK